MSKLDYRLYSFTANSYLSPLQLGLQTAHVVGELSAAFRCYSGPVSKATKAFEDWAAHDKTIIILGAGNHAGVLAVADQMRQLASQLDLPAAIFREDEQSMNCMATAFGVVVPRDLWDVQPLEDGGWSTWSPNDPEGLLGEAGRQTVVAGTVRDRFITILKQHRLA